MACRSLSLCKVVILTSSLLVACSSTQMAPDWDTQQATVFRWNHCLTRFHKQYDGPSLQITQRAKQFCEGYHRDLLALYPKHLKNQIESLLSERVYTIATAHWAETGVSPYWSADNGSLFDLIRLRLIEAQ